MTVSSGGILVGVAAEATAAAAATAAEAAAGVTELTAGWAAWATGTGDATAAGNGSSALTLKAFSCWAAGEAELLVGEFFERTAM